MNDDNIFKVMVAAITSFFGYVIYGIKRNSLQHDEHRMKSNEHEKDIIVLKEQMRSIINKLEDVIILGNELKKDNAVILRALVKAARNDKQK